MPRMNHHVFAIIMDYIYSFQHGCRTSELLNYLNGLTNENYTYGQVYGVLDYYSKKYPHMLRKVCIGRQVEWRAQ